MARETVIDTLVTEFIYRTDAEQLRGLDDKLSKVQSGLRSAAGLFVGVGTAAVGAFAVATGAAINWESAFTGVRKTVDGTEEELATIEATLRRMARSEVPIDHEEIASIAEAAGQLGIQTENIATFTKTMAQLASTTNLSAGEAATQTARFANIFQMSQDLFSNLGSTVVDLGNNFATTEAEIVSMALRLAGAGKLVGLSEAQVLAYATTLSSVGIEAEAGGTAFSRVFVDMQASVQNNSEELNTFAKVSGMARDEFVYTFGRDANQAVVAFLEGLKDMVARGDNVHKMLEDLGFDNVRIRDALLRTAGAGELLNDALSRSDRAWEENTALMREAELRTGTLKSQIQFLKNNLYDLRIEVGNALTPALEPMIAKLKEGLNSLREWVAENPRAVQAAAATSLGLVLLGAALFGASVMVGVLRSAIGAWAWLLDTGVFLKLAEVARNTFAAMAIWGQGAALAVNRAWARTFLIFKFGGLRASVAAFFGWLVGTSGKAFAAIRLGAMVAFRGVAMAAVKALTVLTGGLFWVAVAAVFVLISAWNALWSFLKGFIQGFTEQFPAIRDAALELLDALGPVGDGLRVMFEGLGGVIQWLTHMFGDWTEEGREWGEVVGGAIVSVIEKVTELIEWFRELNLTGGLGRALVGMLRSVGILDDEDDGDTATPPRTPPRGPDGDIPLVVADEPAPSESPEPEPDEPAPSESPEPEPDLWAAPPPPIPAEVAAPPPPPDPPWWKRLMGLPTGPTGDEQPASGVDPAEAASVAPVPALAAAYEGISGGAYAAGFYHAPPAAILPPAPTPATATAAAAEVPRQSTRNTDVRIDRIEINVEHGDPDTIAAAVDDKLKEVFQDAEEDSDDDILR